MVAKVTFYWGKRWVLNGSVQAWWKAGELVFSSCAYSGLENICNDKMREWLLQAVPIQLRILIGLHEDPDNDERAKNHRILDMQTLDTRACKMFQVAWIKLWKISCHMSPNCRRKLIRLEFISSRRRAARELGQRRQNILWGVGRNLYYIFCITLREGKGGRLPYSSFTLRNALKEEFY